MHLHIPDHELRRRYCETFDKDARLCLLPEVAFGDSPELASVSLRLLTTLSAGDHFLIDSVVSDLLTEIIARTIERSRPVLRGGLSRSNARQVRDFIDAHLDASLNLRDIAATAGLSEFHFQRMFQASFGVSPAVWVSSRRTSRAKELLKGTAPIADIAVQCGFSDQSHLTRVFKRMKGITPGVFRKGHASSV
ncbi:MAG: AraC family transcriptional regulator [Salinisphaera sp.]|nr:AraC family transcriptional regulator [Salinisphaera sp.]